MYVRAGVTLVTLLAGLSGQLRAQESCQEQETLQLCWRRITGGVGQSGPSEVAAALNATAEAAESNVEEKSAGLPSMGEGLGSALHDFLPRFAGALGLTQTTTEDGAAAFETNLLVPLVSAPQRIKLQAVLRKPTVYQPLLDALPTSTASGVRDSLERTLADFDDVRLTAAWNLENATFGRAFERVRPYYNAYFEEIVTTALQRSETQARLKSAFRALVARLSDLQDSIAEPAHAGDPECRDAAIQPDDAPIKCLRAEARARIDSVLVPAARLVAARATELQAALTDQGFYEFTDLVNSQPQLQVDVNVDVRPTLVGPNAWAVALRYEGGFSNVNTLRGYCRARQLSDTSPECLRSYLNTPGHRASARRGDRFALSAEFGRESDYVIAAPVALTRAGTWHVRGTATLGRYLAVDAQGDEIGRLDLSSSYVYYHDDAQRQNRLVVSATYTQRVTAAVSVAAGVSYANRPEFLESVDKKVSANFGLRYKFLRD